MKKTAVLSHCTGLAGLLMMFAVSLVGCGVKGPPVPPKAPPVPMVTELSYQIDGDSVVLAWRLPERLARNQAKGSAFDIYQSRTDLAETCEGCPLVFEKVNTLPYVHAEDNRFSTTLSLDTGYRYVFKVRLVTDAQAGPDPDPVQFDFPSAGIFVPTEAQ